MHVMALLVMGDASPLTIIETDNLMHVPYSPDPEVSTQPDPVTIHYHPLDVELLVNNRFSVSVLVDNTMYSVWDMSLIRPAEERHLQWDFIDDVEHCACTANNTWYVTTDGKIETLYTDPLYENHLSLPVAVDRVYCSPNNAVFVRSTEHNQLYALGPNRHGELGLGDTDSRVAFQLVPNVSNVKTVYAGASHTCIVTRDNEYMFAGNNSHRQCLDVDEGRILSFTRDERLDDVLHVCMLDTSTVYVVNNGSNDRFMMHGLWNGNEWPAGGFEVDSIVAVQCTSTQCYFICTSEQGQKLWSVSPSGEFLLWVDNIDVDEVMEPLHAGFDTLFVILGEVEYEEQFVYDEDNVTHVAMGGTLFQNNN